MKVIPTARVPILKLTVMDGIRVDLAVFTKSGLNQASYIRRMLPEYPAARPVCLVAKSLLKRMRLNDVATGGLGGYALANMVLAHCQIMRDSGEADVDYGDVLIRFFQRYAELDFSRYAVTVRQGGILPKVTLEKETKEWVRYSEGWQGRTHGKRLLYVEDPLSGVNISAKTTRFAVVQRNFDLAYRRLVNKRRSGREFEGLDSLFEIGSKYSTEARAGKMSVMCSYSTGSCRPARIVMRHKFFHGLQARVAQHSSQLLI